MNLNEAIKQLESLGDEKRRQFNAKVGPDGVAGAPPGKQFGIKTGDLRTLAKKIKTDHALGLQLWKTGNMDAQMLAILIMKPKELSARELDTMVREAPFAWVADWLQSYIIKEQPPEEREKLREKWMKKSEKNPWAARAGWHLTASKINNPAKFATNNASSKTSRDSSKTSRNREGADNNNLDLGALLDRIEKEMPNAKSETKWTMNNTLAAIAIKHANHRKRAIAIGEKIGLYKDWPVSKGCTIPYVPVWVAAMVKG